MERPGTSSAAGSPAATNVGGEAKPDLNTLSTTELLREYTNPAPRLPGQGSLEAYKDKVLAALFARDMSSFTNREIFRFLHVCPSHASKSIQHAERTLLERAPIMTKKELLKLLQRVASHPTSAEKQTHQDMLIDLLSRKFGEFSPADFLTIMPLGPTNMKQQIMAHLFSIRNHLDGAQLLQLMKEYFIEEPSAEIKGLMNSLYELEKKNREQLVAFTKPVRYQVSSSAQDNPLLKYLAPLPTTPSSYFLDIDFNPITEAQIASEKLGSHSYSLSLVHRLPSPQHGVALFISQIGSDKQHYIGCLTENKPCLPLSYPLPIVGAVSAVRFVATVLPLATIEKEHGSQAAAAPILLVAPSTPAKGEIEVTVCFGETHVFRLQKEDTFEELLLRAARRWNVSPTYHELQDSNFKTLEGQRPVAETLSSNAIIRLTRRGFEAAPAPVATPTFPTPATPSPATPFTPPRPLTNVFAQPPFQFSSLYK